MSRLIVLFIAGFIGLSLRYVILGEFELDQLLLLLAFPVASIAIIFVMKWQYNKDRDFKPESTENHFVTRLGDRVSVTPKKMYKDNKYIGTYERFYNRRWKRIIADIMDNPGQWYLNLSFSLVNGEKVVMKGHQENKIRGNNEWNIYHQKEEVGKIRTNYSVKNAAKLKESLYVEYGQEVYYFKSKSTHSKTEIYSKDQLIATGKRIRNSVYQLKMEELNEKHNAELLFMIFILFNYEFK